MKKRWVVGAMAAALVVGMAVGVLAESTRKSIEVDYSGIQIKVDGRTVDPGSSQPFVVVDEGRTYVPARPLAEALKARVGWDAGTRTVQVYTASYYDTKTVGQTTTYSFPYYGVSVNWPAGGKAASQPGTLLMVDFGPDAAMLLRMDYTQQLGMDATVTAMIAGLSAIMPLHVTSESDIVAAGATGKEIIGTLSIPGTPPLPMHMRVLLHGDSVWAVAAFSQSDPDGSKAKALVNGLSFDK